MQRIVRYPFHVPLLHSMNSELIIGTTIDTVVAVDNSKSLWLIDFDTMHIDEIEKLGENKSHYLK